MKKVLVFLCILILCNSIAFAEGVGFWKNHIEERDTFAPPAVSASFDVLNVFLGDTSLLVNSLGKKGKKSMLEKAKQQLAALLLNVACCLDFAEILTPAELEILQLIDSGATTGATVGDAVYAIEDVIVNGGNLEHAKDLADEINIR
ncbi:MAG: hypothetical protein ACW963_08595 [Candidatus Sifarchaeia archaeon]|jgi:hypothetical protein